MKLLRTFPWNATSIITAACCALILAHQAPAADCESLSNLKLADTTITVAQSIASGSFTPPGGKPLTDLPAFCRVAGVIKPTPDSHIQFETWLPASGWNHKFRGIGNGGFAGQISYEQLANSIRRGYATAVTDDGHEANGLDGSWAYRHPEKVIDFGYRAVHLTAQTAKAVVKAFYSDPLQHSYFDGCSDGGREALMEAQRFPEDYDGILAGAPANYWTHLLSGGLAATQPLLAHPEAYISDLKLPAITAAVMSACDAEDGVKDGVLNDPRKCHFDPSALLCQGEETSSCLTAPQIDALKAIYAGGRDSKGQEIFPGLMPGSEETWGLWVTGQAIGQSLGYGFVSGYFRYMVVEDPTWNPLTANPGEVMRLADEKTARILNSDQSSLTGFVARGGKLILYHGWNDAAISPLNTVKYYRSVRTTMGLDNAEGAVRLYMVPGMGHCFGGPGPNSFGQLGTVTEKGPKHGIFDALEGWVEKGTPPGEIIATKYIGDDQHKTVQMTRPLCPYPQELQYKGSGDSNDSANFSCGAPAAESQ